MLLTAVMLNVKSLPGNCGGGGGLRLDGVLGCKGRSKKREKEIEKYTRAHTHKVEVQGLVSQKKPKCMVPTEGRKLTIILDFHC